MVSSFSTALAAALTVSSSASAQQLIFIPTTTTRTQQIMTPSFLGSGNNYNEPPCRTRRLEPWRQQVREYCRTDALTYCRNNNKQVKEERRAATSQQNSMEDEIINNFFNSIFSPPPSTSQQVNNVQDPFDAVVRSMLDFSLDAFDQIMAEAAAQQQQLSLIHEEGRDEANEEGVDNYPNTEDVDMGKENYPNIEEIGGYQFDEGFEEVGEPKLSTQEDNEEDSADSYSAASEDAEISAMNTMDALVANLAHRSINRAAIEEEGEGAGAQEDAFISRFVDNLPTQLFEIGNTILSEAHSRRRLMEVGEGEGKIDPHLQVKGRLGRRLTEYRQDLFLHPSDGTVTLYTRGLMSPPPVMRSYHPLKMGYGDYVDQCMESRFHNGDLVGDCKDAVQTFFVAVNDRSLTPPPPPVVVRRPYHKGCGTIRASHHQFFTFTSETVNHLKCMLFWLPAMFLLLLALGKGMKRMLKMIEDEEDARDVSFDYSKMPEDGIIYSSSACEGFSMKNVQPSDSEPKVFIGVPVQVV